MELDSTLGTIIQVIQFILNSSYMIYAKLLVRSALCTNTMLSYTQLLWCVLQSLTTVQSHTCQRIKAVSNQKTFP